jgi:hydroxylaminobenzene mutase
VSEPRRDSEKSVIEEVDVTPEAGRMTQIGVLLFLLGLLTGAAVPLFAVPRLGLSAHITGVLGGLSLVVFGLLWPYLQVGPRTSGLASWLAIYAFCGGWLMPLLGGVWGAGISMMPFAAGGARGTPLQEGVIAAGLITSAVAIVVACVVLLWGLRWSSRES